jgi:hypothetical protein
MSANLTKTFRWQRRFYMLAMVLNLLVLASSAILVNSSPWYVPTSPRWAVLAVILACLLMQTAYYAVSSKSNLSMAICPFLLSFYYSIADLRNAMLVYLQPPDPELGSRYGGIYNMEIIISVVPQLVCYFVFFVLIQSCRKRD